MSKRHCHALAIVFFFFYSRSHPPSFTQYCDNKMLLRVNSSLSYSILDGWSNVLKRLHVLHHEDMRRTADEIHTRNLDERFCSVLLTQRAKLTPPSQFRHFFSAHIRTCFRVDSGSMAFQPMKSTGNKKPGKNDCLNWSFFKPLFSISFTLQHAMISPSHLPVKR